MPQHHLQNPAGHTLACQHCFDSFANHPEPFGGHTSAKRLSVERSAKSLHVCGLDLAPVEQQPCL
eukprot:6513446-Alexandrium_andersonii.AAC.1